MGDNLDDDENYYNAPDPSDQGVSQPSRPSEQRPLVGTKNVQRTAERNPSEEDNYYGATESVSGSGGGVKPLKSAQRNPSEEDNYYGATDSGPTGGGGGKLSSIKASLFGSKPAPQTDSGKGSGKATTSDADGGGPTEENDENFYNMPNMDDEATNSP